MMQEAGVARSVLLSLAKGRDDVSRLKDWILSVSRESEEDCIWGCTSIFGTPERFAATIQCFPDLRLVLAHLGGLRMWDDVRRHLLPADGNVYFDTAYVSFYMGQEEMRVLIRDIGPERVLLGSDYPWEEPGRAAEIIAGLGLCEAEREAVLWKNAITILD